MLLSRGVGRWRLCSDPTTTAITAEREAQPPLPLPPKERLAEKEESGLSKLLTELNFCRQVLAQVGMDITFLKGTPAVGERKTLS